MNKEFKAILLNIANLPQADQRWLLAQLTDQQQEQFKQCQGYGLLEKAQQFRKLPCPELPQLAVTIALPAFAKKLAEQDPLYTAIILEQGQFIWEALFLASAKHAQAIEQLKPGALAQIKSATKDKVFKLWQAQLDFADQLEYGNG